MQTSKQGVKKVVPLVEMADFVPSVSSPLNSVPLVCSLSPKEQIWAAMCENIPEMCSQNLCSLIRFFTLHMNCILVYQKCTL